jgi:hypothetical protein
MGDDRPAMTNTPGGKTITSQGPGNQVFSRVGASDKRTDLGEQPLTASGSSGNAVVGAAFLATLIGSGTVLATPIPPPNRHAGLSCAVGCVESSHGGLRAGGTR